MYHYLLKPESDTTQQLILTVGCSNLYAPNDRLPIDSFLVVKIIEKDRPIRQLVKSKIYWGSAHPQYEQAIEIEFSFSKEQNLLLEIYRQQNQPKLYGWVQTTVSRIFGSHQKIFSSVLKMEKSESALHVAKMTINCEKKEKSSLEINAYQMRVHTRNIKQLKNYYFFPCNDPFHFLFTKMRRHKEITIYKSKPAANFKNNSFESFEACKKIFADYDAETDFSLKIYQGHELLGFCKVQIDQCIEDSNCLLSVTNDQGLCVGEATLEIVKQYPKYSLSDYLDSGLEFKVLCCIDFTASNKKQNDPESLHAINHNGSAYEEALKQTLKILLDYNSDKLIPTYGFGAKVFLPNFNSQGKVSHCFPINGNIQNPNLQDVEGVLREYRNCLNYLQFAGPTNFEQIIQNAIQQCSCIESNGTEYMIVFILTDGQIHDTCPVIDLIDRNSHLPLSIVMVGLGNNDFSDMVMLDGDDEPLLNSKGKKVRDIIQFVDFNFCGTERCSLAVNILEQIPIQVLQYYRTKNMCPRKVKAEHEAKQKLKQNSNLSLLSKKKSFIQVNKKHE